MLVVDSLINGSLNNDRAAVKRLGLVPFIMPVMMTIHRTMKTVVKSKLTKRMAIIILHSCISLFQVLI